jgi:hypothetical protein
VTIIALLRIDEDMPYTPDVFAEYLESVVPQELYQALQLPG